MGEGGTTTGLVSEGDGERTIESVNAMASLDWVWVGGSRPRYIRSVETRVQSDLLDLIYLRFFLHVIGLHHSPRPLPYDQFSLCPGRSRSIVSGSSARGTLATGATSGPQATPWVVEGTPAARPCNRRHRLAASASAVADTRQQHGSEIEFFWPWLGYGPRDGELR